MTTLPLIEPTPPQWVNGIISDQPWTLQCQDCGAKVTRDDLGLKRRDGPLGALVSISGYHFHVCQHQQPPVRRCPDCLRASKAACPDERCRESAADRGRR